MSTTLLKQWRTQAVQKLKTANRVPQRYGTAFHLTPPVADVRDLPVTQFTPFRDKSPRATATVQDSGSLTGFTPPLNVRQSEPVVLKEIVSRSHDPYLLWQIAHSDNLPIQHVVAPSGATVEQAIVTSGQYASQLVVVEVQPHAHCTILDHSVDHTVALRRMIVVVAEGASFTYWALRADNTFMTESLRVTLTGRTAAAHVHHVALDGGAAQADLEVNVVHAAPDTTSHITARLAGYASAQTIYRGKITVQPAARGSNGYQHARALLLSPKAVVDVLPELAINTNDVKCSHGVTTLHLDDTALFYLRSRGVPEQQARALALTGFFHEGLAIPTVLTSELDQRIASVYTT